MFYLLSFQPQSWIFQIARRPIFNLKPTDIYNIPYCILSQTLLLWANAQRPMHSWVEQNVVYHVHIFWKMLFIASEVKTKVRK